MDNLYPHHYEELKASGLNDAIIERYFYSIAGEAAQEWLIEDRLNTKGHAGQYATKANQSLLEQSEHVKGGGWICIANAQIKPDSPRQELAERNGEYLPVFKPDGSPSLIKYELKREKPYLGAHISAMLPIGSEPRKAADGSRLIVPSEGGKKGGALATLGYESIPLPGVDMGSYKADGGSRLIPALAEIEPGTTVAIAFDADAKKKTRRSVAGSLARLAELLIAAGCDVVVPTWSSKVAKGIDDLLVAKGADAVHEAIATAKPFEQWKAALPATWFRAARPAGYKKELKRIEAMHAAYNARPKADITLNQRYLGKGTLPVRGSAALMDSTMSTGKTSSYLAGIIEEHRKKHPDAIGISSAYRNILLRQMGENLDITHHLDTDGDPSLSKYGYLSACPESLPKLASQKIPAGSIFIADEVVAWLTHVFTSDTMKSGADRVAVLMAIKTLFAKIIDGGGFIIGMEANIPQWAIDCLRDLLPAQTPVSLTRNEYAFKADKKAYFYDKLTALKIDFQSMNLKGQKLLIASDSATQIDDQFRGMFPFSSFFVSAKNSADKEAQAFATDPQGFLLNSKINTLGFSPTIGAGVSIDDVEGGADDVEGGQFFDAVGGVYTHLTSSAAAQQTGRYRTPVDQYIYCQNSGNGIGDGDLSIFDPQALKQRYRDDAAYCHSLVGFASYLKQFGNEDLISTLKRSLSGEQAEIALLDKWRCVVTAVENFDKLHLRDNLKAKLKARGYKIVDLECGNIPGASEEFKAIKEEAQAKNGKEFAALEVPENLSPDEARTILSTHGHSRIEVLQAKKALYQFEFPDADLNNSEFCTEWLVKNKGKKLTQLRTEWAARNPEAAKSIDRWHLKNKLKQARNLNTGVSMADVSQHSPAADAFAKAGLPDAIDAIGAELYNNNHPEIQRIGQWAEKNKKLLKQVFRMRFDQDRSYTDIFNSLARKLGYAPKAEKASGKDGQREKQYVLSDFTNPDRGHMLKSLSDKFTARLEQKGEALSGQTLAPKTEWTLPADALEKRAYKKPMPIASVEAAPKPASPEQVGWAWHLFERDLIEAQSMEQLKTAKDKASESLRCRVMADWQSDGRFDWLASKARKLSEVV